ncbi:MAG: NAD-dependent epimerase/dehydratase family protein [Oscillospiraceae bacterium]
MKALVLGATGFVGARVAQYLIRLGHEVDIFSRGEKPLAYSGVHTFYKGDRHSPADLSVLSANRYEAVIDTSGYTADDVLLAVRAVRRDKLVRYIFCSSGAVYLPSDRILAETDPVGNNPNWGAYGTDKLAAERALLALYKQEQFPVTVFRPSYIYGEGNNLYRESLLFDRFSQNLAVPIPDSSHKTQFVHIDDIAACFARCLHLPVTSGRCYNLTHPEPIGWRQLAEAARRLWAATRKSCRFPLRSARSPGCIFHFGTCLYAVCRQAASAWPARARNRPARRACPQLPLVPAAAPILPSRLHDADRRGDRRLHARFEITENSLTGQKTGGPLTRGPPVLIAQTPN